MPKPTDHDQAESSDLDQAPLWEDGGGDLLPEPIAADSVQLEVRVGDCPSCMRTALSNPPVAIRIITIEMRDFGWLATGEIGGDNAVCKACGALYAQVLSLIPIECGEYPCPKCGSAENLLYEVVRVELVDGVYEFVAQFTCRACRKRGKLREFLRGIQRIKKLKLGPGGIEIEQADREGLKTVWRGHPDSAPWDPAAPPINWK